MGCVIFYVFAKQYQINNECAYIYLCETWDLTLVDIRSAIDLIPYIIKARSSTQQTEEILRQCRTLQSRSLKLTF